MSIKYVEYGFFIHVRCFDIVENTLFRITLYFLILPIGAINIHSQEIRTPSYLESVLIVCFITVWL